MFQWHPKILPCYDYIGVFFVRGSAQNLHKYCFGVLWVRFLSPATSGVALSPTHADMSLTYLFNYLIVFSLNRKVYKKLEFDIENWRV